MVTVQLAPVAVSQPAQLENEEPAVGDAVSVTTVPFSKGAEQLAPQVSPPPVTVPEPAPAFAMLSTGASVLPQ
jgi:hypothetical protein